MATWRSTALAAAALVLLAGVQTVVCIDDPKPLCNITKATTCYWSQAHVYGVWVLKPRPEEQEKFLKNVCVTKTVLPEYSVCSEYYNECSEEQKNWFEDQENGYKHLQKKVTDPIMCKGVEALLTCIDKTVVQQCQVKFAKEYTSDNAKKNYNAAMNLSNCIKNALEPCKGRTQTTLETYLNEIAEAVTKLYIYKPLPPSPSPPTAPTTTESQTTTSPTTPITPDHTTLTSTTHQSTTQESTTHQSPTQETTTHQSTTQESTTHQSSTLPPTTPAPPSAAPSVHAVSAFGFIALALLARGA